MTLCDPVTCAMRAVSGCRGTVGLLTMLCVAALSGAHQPLPAASATQQRHSEDALDQLLTLVGRAVTTAAEPIVAELNSQRQLLDNIVSKLSSQDSRLDSLNSRLDSVSAQLDSRVSSLGSRLDSLGTELAGLSVGPVSPPACSVGPAAASLPRDCSDLPAGTSSGVHLVQPGLGRRSDPAWTFCDMTTDGGGWTVFQRRADLLPREDFYRDWTEYKNGFGQLEAEFWWGLQKLWLMTAPLDRRYELRVDLEDFAGERRHAVYQEFRISSESDGYRMTGANYTGDAGDSLSRHFGDRFSTKDKDLDTGDKHCAQIRKGAWWYDDCHESNLNGEYLSGKTSKDTYGVNWKAWRGYNYSLKTVEMKIRPIQSI